VPGVNYNNYKIITYRNNASEITVVRQLVPDFYSMI